jgi:hypothetical protein
VVELESGAAGVEQLAVLQLVPELVDFAHVF